MGNCVQRSGAGLVVEAGRRGVRLQQPRRRSAAGEKEADGVAPPPPSVVKLKMVLTKAELGWLVAQLKAGDRRLEDVLQEMARKREGGAADGWRPSLESIVECPAAELSTAAAASSDD
ncbi:hypothetical protein BS78_04G108000 [Paspalum vaginatum]|nr:hypothetical protein BS78_04G108000 [Paspalum vaginatum]